MDKTNYRRKDKRITKTNKNKPCTYKDKGLNKAEI